MRWTRKLNTVRSTPEGGASVFRTGSVGGLNLKYFDDFRFALNLIVGIYMGYGLGGAVAMPDLFVVV